MWTLRAGGRPEMLALVDISAELADSHNLLATGCVVCRTAIPECSPRIHQGTSSDAGKIQVTGRESLEGRELIFIGDLTQRSNWSTSDTITTNPISGLRFLMCRIRLTAKKSSGMQPRPKMPSVG
tara:strand:- start:94 stop:468 length:375 start_codon:yes stop_codon:yes gene_type:complete